MRFTKTLIIGASLLALTACQGQNNTHPETTPNNIVKLNAENDVNVRINDWFNAYDEASLKRYPERLAARGIKERMDEWNDMSKSFYLEGLDRRAQAADELKANFDRADLTPQNQLSYDIFLDQTDRMLEGRKWYDYRYAFNQMYGTHSGIPTFLLNQHKIENLEDAQAYIARLQSVDKKLGPVIKYAKESFDKGIAPPAFVYGHVLRDIDNIVSGAPFDDSDKLNLMLDNLKKKTEKLNLTEAQRETLFTDAITALQNVVGPAYAELRTELQRQQASASTDDGVWKLPNGADYYAYELKMMTTTDMTPSEIHDLGLSEVDRIHSEMRDIMKQVGFEGTLQEFFEFTRSDPQFFYTEDGGKERYLSEATDLINIMKGELDSVFIQKPKAELEVRAVEAFREQSAGKAFYSRPAADGSRPGYYYANLYRMEDMPIYQMEALAYHEGIPGHHMQLAIAQELEGIPDFRKYARFTAYTEGWGLYSEFLPKEMGFYEDPYSDFGRLAMELWRAARLVVDTGLHDKKWTREKAIDYLVTNTPNPKGDCVKAIERYIVMPGQATAYKIGMNKILDLRAKAKTALGDKYDIREFHDVVLRNGPLPLSVLEDQVDAYIAEKQ
ncbi:uncharacterized protein (DUF885 family) [Litorimonas taeanensis]|uniref:Uncharacterized protein (DUF885 family) n=1 Tax=Litorimonas taeanensis TaxID=568099 RepID=A0A420WJE5_9PROT|nr:DUF885 domain-containing protein [Litorimonas taeanensis]RKQ71052.1 uncharacterized protein (DUF885 family) [Litorimonas taeanensis]